jgi:hypothetical protein
MRGFSKDEVLELPVPSMVNLYELAAGIYYADRRDEFYARLLAAHGTKEGIESFVKSVYEDRMKSAEERAAEKKAKIGESIRGLMRDLGA